MIDLERLVAALGGADVVGRAPVEVRDLAYDARTVVPGSLFFCVPGAVADGHDFARDAVKRGAVALVVERPLGLGVPEVVVSSSRAAMAQAADEFFGRPTDELHVAGVTGTNGKTTTTFLLYAILAAAGRRPGLIGTIEARVGGERRGVKRTTPEAIDLQRLFREMLDAGDRSVAMEASSHASALHRLDRVRFAALVFTNLSHEHLDFHTDMEDYFQAKRRLFVEGDPPAAVNVGVDYGHKPLALETLLRAVRELAPDGRVICVFGCGGDRDREKRPQMGKLASELADVVIVTNDNPRSEAPQEIIDEIVAGAVAEVEIEPDRSRAIGQAIELARDGDVVLIAGKGAEQGQEFADRTVPFDDRETAREALRTLGART